MMIAPDPPTPNHLAVFHNCGRFLLWCDYQSLQFTNDPGAIFMPDGSELPQGSAVECPQCQRLAQPFEFLVIGDPGPKSSTADRTPRGKPLAPLADWLRRADTLIGEKP